MNHSVKKQLHEKNRRRHKHEQLEHAREVARRGRSRLPMWLLVIGLVLLVGAVVALSLR
jgi:hypothetical protein